MEAGSEVGLVIVKQDVVERDEVVLFEFGIGTERSSLAMSNFRGLRVEFAFDVAVLFAADHVFFGGLKPVVAVLAASVAHERGHGHVLALFQNAYGNARAGCRR